MHKRLKSTTSALLGLLLCCQCAVAQSQETAEKENRLSIGLMGGVTHGHLNLGRYLQEEYKNFDVGNNLTVQLGSISVTLPPKTSLCSLTPCSVSFHSTVIITTRRISLLKITISPLLLLPGSA